MKYKSLKIHLIGLPTKGYNQCCFWTTIFFGRILIFPLTFICCDWWKKLVQKSFAVDVSGYEAMAELLKKSRADDVYLMVQDNFFNEYKAKIIISALRDSSVKNFVFSNTAMEFNI